MLFRSLTYTYTGNDSSVDIVINGPGYLRTIVVTYPQLMYAVSFSTLTNGSIKQGDDMIASDDYFAAGTELTVTPAEGYKIKTVTVTNTSTSADVTASVYSAGVITMPAYAITIAAEFEEDKTTALDNTNADSKAIKVIRNGQLVIIRDGVEYDALGNRL